MKIPNAILTLVLAGLCLCGLEHSADLQAATVTLSSTTNSGYCAKQGLICQIYKGTSDLPKSALLLGKQFGPATNRIFLCFPPNPVLKAANITSVQLQFSVVDVTNWLSGFMAKFREFTTTGTDCTAVWTDAADGTDYGQFNLQAQHGLNTADLNANAIAALSAAMNAGQEFRLGITTDDPDLALIRNDAGNTPVLIVTYGCILPGAPTGVMATDGACNQVTVNWNPAAGATSYRIFRNSVSIGTTNAPPFVYQPSNEEASLYAVQAVNDCGSGTLSIADSGSALLAPLAPTGVTASDGTNCGYVHIIWNAAARASSYRITRDGQTISTTSGTYCDDYPGDALLHAYVVLAVNGCGATPSPTTSGRAGATPIAPTGLSASDGLYANYVRLTWNAAAGATAYEVWRSSVNNSGTASLLNGNVISSTFTNSSAEPFTSYYYWVKAKTTCGVSEFSAGDSGWASAVPGVATNLVATYGTFSNRIEVSWAQVLGATSYLVYRNTANSTDGASILATTGDTSYSDSAVTPCVPYWYWIRAANNLGTGGFSSSASGFAGSVPSVPTGVAASYGDYTDRVRVSWNAAERALGYQVWRAPKSNLMDREKLADTAELFYEDSTAAPCTQYSYSVTATNACTISGFSAAATGYAAAGPMPPTNVTATAGLHTRYVQVCWSPVSGATGYTILTNATDDVGTAGLLTNLAVTCYDDYAIPPATTNYYWVRATNACGVSDWSSSTWGYRGQPLEVAIEPIPAGCSVVVDDTNTITSLQTFFWEPGSCHTLSAQATQYVSSDIRFVWTAWSQGGASSNQVCPAGNTNYTALFQKQYCLTMRGSAGGTFTPTSSWYNEGQTVPLQATPTSGYTFSGWTGTGVGAYTGTDNPAEVTLNSPVSEKATFTYTNPCNYSLLATNTSFSALGGTGMVMVATDSPCGWTLTNTCDWLTILSLPGLCPEQVCPEQPGVRCGCGEGLVTYRVDVNTATGPRFCTLQLMGQSLIITQAEVCSYTLGSSSTNIGATAFSGSFSVTAGSGCPWTQETTYGWIHPTSSGSDSGIATYNVDANPSTNPRSGIVVVEGWAFIINQAGAPPPPTFAKATYNGLFYVTPGTVRESSGFLTVATTSKATFSGKVSVEGKSYSFRGQFNTSGQADVVVPRRGSTSLILHLQLEGENALSGTVENENWLASLHADKSVFSALNPCGYAGLYTFRIAGNDNPANRPGGDSYGTFKVDARGKATLVGSLADGAKITQSTYVAADGRLPLFVSLYRGAGLLIGWMEFPAAPAENMGGQAVWLKSFPLSTSARYYPLEFNEAVVLDGMKYTPPTSQPVFNFSDGTVSLVGGNLAEPLALAVRLLPNNKLEIVPSTQAKLRLTLNASSGKFSGSFSAPPFTRSCRFQGILVRQWNGGYGYFLGTDQSGYVRIGPAAP